jgi:O-antigen/teichoic acid export membrane protein
MKSKAGLVAKNSAIILVGKGSGFLFSIVSVILIARYLGAEVFGEYAFIRAVGIVATPLIACGTSQILIREMSVDKERAPVLLFSAFILEILSCICVLFITRAFIFILPETERTVTVCIYLVLIAQTLFIMQGTVCSVFYAAEKVIYETIITIFTRILSLLAVIIVIFFNLKLVGLFGALIIAYLTGFLVSCFMLTRNFFTPKPVFNLRTTLFLLKESYPLSISNIITQAYLYINVFVLKFFYSPVQISFFQIPQRVIEPLKILPRSVMGAILPTFAQLGRAAETRERLLSMYHRLLKYIMICSSPICILATIYAASIISSLFGREYLGAVIPFQISIWTIIFFFINIMHESVLTALMKQKLLMISNGLCLFVNFLLGIILVPKYAAVGASVAMACGAFCLCVLNFYFIFKYLGEVKFLLIAIPPIIGGAIMWFLINSLSGDINMVFLILFSLAAYIGMLFSSKTFTPGEIDIFKTAVQKTMCRFGLSKANVQ